MALGTGRLSVLGYETSKRQSIEVREGSDVLFRGWIQNQQLDNITGISQYQIEGLRANSGRKTVEVTQSALSVNSNSVAVTNLLRDAFEVSSVDVNVTATPLSLFRYRGGAAGFASRYALVSGALPYVTTVGGVGVRDPSQVPDSGVPVINSATHRIAKIDDQFVIDQLWNDTTASFTQYETGVELTHDGVGTFTESDTSPEVTINLPNAGAGSEIINVRVSSVRIVPRGTQAESFFSPNGIGANARGVGVPFLGNNTGYTVSINNVSVSGNSVTFDTNLTDFGRWAAGSLPVGRTQLPPNQYTGQTFYFSTVENDWSAFVNGYINAPAGGRSGRYHISRIEITFRVSYQVRLDLGDIVLTASDTDSISEWGERMLNFPTWFAPSAGSSLQARISRLAQPRNIHTVTMYVDQRNAARTSQVAAIQPGDHIDLVDVGQTVYVMNVEYRLSARRSNIKVLTCIETGQGTTPVTPVSNALAWKGRTLRWRNRDLTWR